MASFVGYMTFDTEAAALARNHTEAVNRGCDPNGITQYWWPYDWYPDSSGRVAVLFDALGDYSATAGTGPNGDPIGRQSGDPAFESDADVLAVLNGGDGTIGPTGPSGPTGP